MRVTIAFPGGKLNRVRESAAEGLTETTSKWGRVSDWQKAGVETIVRADAMSIPRVEIIHLSYVKASPHSAIARYSSRSLLARGAVLENP
jgi:hypothetical protein